MQEQRRFVRLNVDVDIKWKEISESEKKAQIFNDSTKDISAGGICLFASELLTKGTLLLLTIELPEKKIKARGIVKWSYVFEISSDAEGKKYETGIQFTDISKEDSDSINKFVFGFPRKKQIPKE